MVNEVDQEKYLRLSPYVPYDSSLEVYVQSEGHSAVSPTAGGVHPFEYTGWCDEELSWHNYCYLHAGLNPTGTYHIKGPDVLKVFSSHCVNSFANFPVGKGKHGIMCNEDGYIVQDGMVLRLGEDEFITYWMFPYIAYALQKGNCNVRGELLTGKVFLYQLAGPRSLEVVEAATGEDLRDIKFIHFRDSRIDGRKVTILRMGMAGTLAYEVHGQIQDAILVYNALLKAGKAFGIRRLGRHAYRNAHTEGGFPQMSIHYQGSYDKGFIEFLQKAEKEAPVFGLGRHTFTGSLEPDIRLHWRNPVEVGWTGMIKFDHDFIGRKALEKEMVNPRRQMVTLVWNAEDCLDVYRSQFQPGEPYNHMELVEDYSYLIGSAEYHADKVLMDGQFIGISSGRMFSPYYHEMISLCSINTTFSGLGTEVTVLWGNRGTRQKEIRATVSRFPYIDKDRNEHFDVNQIPRPDVRSNSESNQKL
ncbi:MAG TPA: aminomethyl transferase family protein [Dehalococcoidia bacterium]|nr:aminomethyl transferase family protein [Dehalococcoidia bacterium]